MVAAFDFGQFMSDFALTWIPVLFFFLMCIVVYLLWRTVKLMPRVKPMEITPGSASSVTWSRRRRARRGEGGAAGDRRLPPRPAEVRVARRARAEGDPLPRASRHRQDARREGRRARVRRAVLRAERLGVRRDVRRPRRRTHPQALRGSTQERAVDRLHRRARRRRPGAQRPLVQPRAGSDAQPAARRARRLRPARPGRRHGARRTACRISTRRCCAPAGSTGRS